MWFENVTFNLAEINICNLSQTTFSDSIAKKSFQMRIFNFLPGVLTLTFGFTDFDLRNDTSQTIDPNSSFLVLTTAIATNIPFVMDFNENFMEKPSFQFGSKTEVFWSCSTTMNGEFYIFGGFHEKRQVSLVSGLYWKFLKVYRVFYIRFEWFEWPTSLLIGTRKSVSLSYDSAYKVDLSYAAYVIQNN